MPLTQEKIESLAPDQPSLSAALKLLKPATWPVLAASADASLLWGECQGSGSTPYRVVVSPDDVGYKCTCPSRKFPCKHVLAVLWLKVDQPARFVPGQPPPWVEEWSARRRPGTGRPSGKPKVDDDAAKPAPSLDAALADPPEAPKEIDPKAAARAEAQRQRLKAEREAGILSGLDELDRWTIDQLSQGMAGFTARAQAATRTLSTRLVDAKAPGLATRLDRLATDLFRTPEASRADVAIERLAATTLIASAYRHQDRLPPFLREDVRRAAGWTVRREDLLADTNAPRVTAQWIAVANLSEVQPDKLRRLETWLVNATPVGAAPRVAVLVDYVPVAGGFGFPFENGERLEGEVVFYPSAAPLRGLLVDRKQATSPRPWPSSNAGLGPGLAEFDARLAALPWLDTWPLLADDVEIRLAGKGQLAITDVAGHVLPLDRGQCEALMPMVGLGRLSVLVNWDGRLGRLVAADTPLGAWHEG
ncbi:MAG: SWIM zinc finger family protein [Hyphomicrobiaceae bacterium]